MGVILSLFSDQTGLFFDQCQECFFERLPRASGGIALNRQNFGQLIKIL
jgi:hypothetical protein